MRILFLPKIVCIFESFFDEIAYLCYNIHEK